MFCGLGHIAGSIILGILGVVLGLAGGMIDSIESIRGDIASWLLIGFGIAYTAWGLRIGLRAREHSHDEGHSHGDSVHSHSHHHLGSHSHVHGDTKQTTPWVLFLIFVLGPCEPLVPILMYPAAKSSWVAVLAVAGIFGLTTIATMMVMVSLLYFSASAAKKALPKPVSFLEDYAHAIAGVVIALSGMAIKFLGL